MFAMRDDIAAKNFRFKMRVIFRAFFGLEHEFQSFFNIIIDFKIHLMHITQELY